MRIVFGWPDIEFDISEIRPPLYQLKMAVEQEVDSERDRLRAIAKPHCCAGQVDLVSLVVSGAHVYS
jgi:hypothetical protein